MCESSAYWQKEGDLEELILEDVVMLRPDGGRIILTNILGDRKELEAEIDHIDLLHHKIILRPAK
ncbi:MAG: CooT family nickel-binding protein [Deltaproteobacteria bacterium]|nr:CooT family nickel-binding protein [Deltaproteobacteria bacterium]